MVIPFNAEATPSTVVRPSGFDSQTRFAHLVLFKKDPVEFVERLFLQLILLGDCLGWARAKVEKQEVAEGDERACEYLKGEGHESEQVVVDFERVDGDEVEV